MRTNNLKTKILFILTAVILGVASIVTLYNVVHDKRQDELRMEDAYQSVSLHYEETIKDIVDFYIARTYANINTVGVLEVVRSHDHDKLYTLISPRWEVMRKENPALSVMQFHNADGTSLLRMHRPNVYGDNIASQRAMVAHIHQYHKTVYGFEEGREGLAFRILVPIIDHGTYLGALE
ncbi:cache domain-containing protein, partial [Sulfuricurvum sp.]|uniref:cache domain-containing protein n=1 Tax=Sulfuricurvum sp. TaxID=2025608 RepID=UPI003BAFDB38